MRPNRRAATFLAVLPMLLAATTAGAATLTVTDTGDSGTGTLRQALADAADGDLIDFDLTLPATITLTSGQLEVADDVEIQGPGADRLTVSGGGSSRVFFVRRLVTATIAGLSITDGAEASGGGIVVFSGGFLALVDCTVSGNSASSTGGGIFNGGTVSVTRSTVSGNSGPSWGGGIYNLGTLSVTNSTVSGNSNDEPFGAGIHNVASTVISHSTIAKNGGPGRGIDSNTGTLTIKSSVVAGNTDGDCAPSSDWTAEGTNFATDGTCPGFTQVTSAQLALGPLQDNGGTTETHALLPGSVAVDAATDCTDTDGDPVTEDQLGRARPIDGDGDTIGRCDAGAYEAPGTFRLAVDTPSAPEGGADHAVVFTVTNPGGAGSVELAPAAGSSATPGSDFTGPGFPVPVSFGAGETSKTVEVLVRGDTLVESDETIVLTLQNPTSGAAVGVDATATHTILNDDTAQIAIAGASLAEGTGGTTAFDFDVTLSNAVDGGLTVGYATNDGTATEADGDYTDDDGSLAFTGTAGEVETVTVQVAGDAVIEPDEAFSVALGAVSGLAPGIDPADLSITGSPATGTMMDDDAGISDAVFMAEKTVAGDGALLPGTVIDYTLLVTNLGPADRADLPGDELVDVLPAELELLSADADVGTAAADPGPNTVTWNGALAAGESAVVTIEARIAEDVPLGTPVTNQATVAFDGDNDGALDGEAVSDDPGSPGAEDPTTFLVAADSVLEIPTLGPWGLGLLTLVLAGLAALRLRG